MTRTIVRPHYGIRWLGCVLILMQAAVPNLSIADGLAGVSGGTVVAGQAAIAQDGSTLNVNTMTDRTIINWNGFSIGAGETANFLQPNASSAVLNRVTTPNNPTAIYGALNSNGNVILVNPSGIIVGKSGVINTNGFTASVLDLPNNEFLQGGPLNFRGDSTASVINEGTIKTGAGGAALIGGDVVNRGMITSDGGSISLATGGSVTLADGSRFTHADLATIEAGISPYAGLIQNSGTIRATGAIETGGEVYLVNPGGKIMHDGTIAAHRSSATGQIGGDVTVEADNIQLASAEIDASGAAGGGHVRVGGGFQGMDSSMTNATTTSVDAGSVIKADATDNGNGGNVVVWSNEATAFAGTITATGGARGGDGGLVEVSGAALQFDGRVDTTAPLGNTGWLLLDPAGIAIVPTGGSHDAVWTLTDVQLNAFLGSNNITLATSPTSDEVDVIVDFPSGRSRTGMHDDNIVVSAGTSVDTGANTLYFSTGTVELHADIAGNVAGGAASSATLPEGFGALRDPSTVNVFAAASIQDGVDIVGAGGLVNVGDGSFAGGIAINKALTLLGDGFSNTTTVNVADGTAGITVNSSGVTIDGFLFAGDGTPANATGVLVDGSAGALNNILVGDSGDPGVLGNKFDGLTTGLLASDGATGNAIGLELGVGNQFTGNTDGIVLTGSGIDIAGNTINNTAFWSHSGNFIELAGGAEFQPGQPTVIDARDATFDGLKGSQMTAAQLLATEDKIFHYPDDNTLGLVDLATLFVVEGESIQLAVNAAGALSGAQTVVVGNGTFGGSVETWVDDLTLLGAGNSTIIDTDLVDPFANNGDRNNGFEVTTISNIAPGLVVDDLTIDGFRFVGSGGTTGIDVATGLFRSANDLTITNASFDGLQDGIIARRINGATTFSNLAMTNIDNRGIDVRSNLFLDSVTIADSEITSGGNAVRFDGSLALSQVELRGNSLTSTMSDALQFDNNIAGSSVLIGGNDFGDANQIAGADDGIDFDGQINLSRIQIARNSSISGVDEAIDFDNELNLGSLDIVGNTTIEGMDNGIEFDDRLLRIQVTIAGNDSIKGDEDAIVFNGPIIGSNVNIGLATVDLEGGPAFFLGNDEITGGEDGINVNEIFDSQFTVYFNGLIEGTTGSGIEFDGRIDDESEVVVTNNQSIIGGDYGIEFDDFVEDSYVDISFNDRIHGEDISGISFRDAVVDSEVEMFLNDEISGGDDAITVEDPLTDSSFRVFGNSLVGINRDGVSFEAPIRGDSSVILFSNEITAEKNGFDTQSIQDDADVSLFRNDILVTGDGSGIRLRKINSSRDVVVFDGSTTGGSIGLNVLQSGEAPRFGGVLVFGLVVNEPSETGIQFLTSGINQALFVALFDEVTVNGGTDPNVVGMVFDGEDISLLGDTLADTRFVGTPGNFIELRNGALFEPGRPTLIDGTGVYWDGLLPEIPAQRQQIINRIVDYLDDPTLGLIFPGTEPPADQTYDRFTRYQDFFRTYGALMGPYSSGSITYPTPTVEIAEGLGEE